MLLQDKDRIFRNLYGFHDWKLAGARQRGAWDGTKALIDKGADWIINGDAAYYKIIQSVLVAHLHGNAAQISVEIGRGNVPSPAQPSFLQLEEALNNIPAEA